MMGRVPDADPPPDAHLPHHADADHHPGLITDIVIRRQHMGPPGSSNGGYLSGVLADHVDAPAVTVTLRLPPPLEVPLALVRHGEGVRLLEDQTLVAEAEPGELDLEPVEPVAYDEAVAATERFGGLAGHPFPGCFVCGTDRDPGDALRLRPGPVEGRAVVATPWTPPAWLHEHAAEAADVPEAAGGVVAPEHVWAALDCPGGWAVDLPGRPMVLGRITARVDRLPAIGERLVVVGWVLAREGRKAFVGSALYGADGSPYAVARATWLAVDPAKAGRPS